MLLREELLWLVYKLNVLLSRLSLRRNFAAVISIVSLLCSLVSTKTHRAVNVLAWGH